MNKRVLVTGDLVEDHNLVAHPDAPTLHGEPFPHTVMTTQEGGASYLCELISKVCADVGVTVHHHSVPDARWTRAFYLWSKHPRRLGEKSRVWRISRFLGCQAEREAKSGEAGRAEPPDESPDAEALVIDDLWLGYNENTQAYRSALDSARSPNRVILKMGSPLDDSLLFQELLEGHRDRLTVVLSSQSLRARGAAISEGLSWDRTIEDTVNEFYEGLSREDLGRCMRVVVLFGLAGVASFTRVPLPGPKSEEASLLPRARLERFVFHPKEVERAWKEQRPGNTFGGASIVTAAIVRHTLHKQSFPLYIALGRALAAARLNHEIAGGSGETMDPRCSREAVLRTLLHQDGGDDPAISFSSTFAHRLLESPPLNQQKDVHSNLLRDATGSGTEFLVAKGTEIVLNGVNAALGMTPEARYHYYRTVDREEIERVNVLRSLIKSYVANSRDRQPLSIAVFGPPGSGKSFAIKQLAKVLFGGDKGSLEFNLSQFDPNNLDQLHEAFHEVRDASIRGSIPLVFWDEFDSMELLWLQHFLAPMQDSEFRAGSIAHPFGRAIFVFAGGTSPSFERFDKSKTDGEKGDLFRARKGPDFVSRLRGYVNIKGPNPMNPDQPSADPAYIIRRAMLLRAMLEIHRGRLIDKRTKIASISTSIVRGFLLAREFFHGARSLESLVKSSDLGARATFGLADLPTQELLRVHVSEDFSEIAKRAELEIPVIEAIAREIHEAWRSSMEEAGYKNGPERIDVGPDKRHPLIRSYDELSPSQKELNRLPARVTRAKLAAAGIKIVKDTDGSSASRDGAIDEKTRQRLIEIEHDVWMRDHMLQGWEYAEETSDALRLHRNIAPLSELSRQDRALDERIVDSIPKALEKHGYRLELDRV